MKRYVFLQENTLDLLEDGVNYHVGYKLMAPPVYADSCWTAALVLRDMRAVDNVPDNDLNTVETTEVGATNLAPQTFRVHIMGEDWQHIPANHDLAGARIAGPATADPGTTPVLAMARDPDTDTIAPVQTSGPIYDEARVEDLL